MMNRRDFCVGTIGSATAAACHGNPQALLSGQPLEINLGDPGAMSGGHWRCGATNAFIRLEEIYPADPGELSGAELRIIESGDNLNMAALIGHHWVGCLDARHLGAFSATLQAEPDEFLEMSLFEFEWQYMHPLSGAKLVYNRGILGLYMGKHCLGVAGGNLLKAFLECASYRCSAPSN